MDMKKLLESMDNIEECGTNEGMPMVPPALPQPTEDKGNPVTVNVSMNASGKEHVADLLDMMKNAGLGGAEEVSAKTLSPRMDMERLKGIIDGPEDMDDLKPGMQGEPCPKCGKKHLGASNCMDDIEMDDEAVAEYDNEPDEEYKSLDDVIASGDDLHRTKKAYAATQDGDNPMAVEDEQDALEQEIRAALQNEYASFKEGEPEGDHDHDEGEECPECGAPGKQKLMACSSCGCS